MISARRAPNFAYLSVGAAISGLTSKILEQVLTGQPPLERHAFAWIGSHSHSWILLEKVNITILGVLERTSGEVIAGGFENFHL